MPADQEDKERRTPPWTNRTARRRSSPSYVSGWIMAVLKLTQPSEARLLPPRPVREPPERKQSARSACNPAPALARPRRAPCRVRGQPQDGWAHIAGHTAGICGRRLAQRERPEREWEAYATRLDAAGAMGQLQAPPVVHDGLLSAPVAYSRAHSVAPASSPGMRRSPRSSSRSACCSSSSSSIRSAARSRPPCRIHAAISRRSSSASVC